MKSLAHLEGEGETLYISDKHSEKSTLENRQWSCPTLAFSPGVGGSQYLGVGLDEWQGVWAHVPSSLCQKSAF